MNNVDTLTSLLEPEHGLARKANVNAIEMEPYFFSVIIDVGQRLGGREFGLDDRVGAWDVTLRGAIERGVGEAVERYALKRLATPEQVKRSDIETRELISDASRLPRPSSDSHFLEARRERQRPEPPPNEQEHIADDVWIPADWVDYPASEGARAAKWYGTPSGTAAHLSLELAKDSSLRELFERDAVTRAWYGLTAPTRVDLTEVSCRSANRLKKILSAHDVHLYRVPSRDGLPDTHIAWCVTGSGAAAGSSLTFCPGCAALHAAIEALQVSALLREANANTSYEPVDDGPSNFAELSNLRMRYWASRPGLDSWKKWDVAAGTTARPEGRHLSSVLSSQDVSKMGFTHLWVDLTSRLPHSIREAGFRVVKSVIPEIFALPMSEGERWNDVGRESPYAPWEPLL